MCKTKCMQSIENISTWEVFSSICPLLLKGAIYLISILQQAACICFHGDGKKEVNLIHVLQSIKVGGPYQVLAVYKYAIVPTTIGKTCLKITKTIFGYISGYPIHF